MTAMDTELDRRRRYRYAQILEASKDQRKNPVKQACEICCDVTITLYGLQTIQGVPGVVDARILLINQTIGSENGIWLMRTDAWVRAYDANTSDSLDSAVVAIKRGTYADTLYLQTADDITVDVTALVWTAITNDVELQGPQGIPGPKGDTGDIGPQGIPGITDWGGITGNIADQLDLKAALESIPQARVQGLTVSDTANFNSIILPTGYNKGLLIDPSAPTFGWKDLTGQIHVRGTGGSDPTMSLYRTPLRQFQFTVNQEIFIEFHMPHDYAVGTDIFIHTHWSHILTTVTGGNVTWGFNVSYSKGHNQAAFDAVVNTSVVSAASIIQYQHIIPEIQLSAATPTASQIQTSLLEPDGVLLVRCFLAAQNITTSGGTANPFLHFVDLHHQSTQMSTKNKAPNFYI